jgi:hypothetical protein
MIGAGRRRGMLVLSVALACGLSMLDVSCGVRKAPPGAVVTVPHTGKAYPQGRSLLVSPDERWISLFERESKTDVTIGLSSIELATGRYVRHELGGIDVQFYSPGRPPSMEIWALFQGDSEYVGWSSGRLYLSRGEGKDAFVLDNDSSAVRRGRAPNEPLQISDGFVHQYLARAISKVALAHDGWSSGNEAAFSLAWRNGRYGETLFWYDHRAREVYSLKPDGRVRTIRKIRDTLLKSVTVEEVRVSPDERFLAYTTVAQLKAAVPTPYMRAVVTVRELESRREVEVGRYRYVANLIWGRDGGHLYFIGGGDTDTVAVRIADIAGIFDR